MIKKIRQMVYSWLKNKEIDCFIGFTQKDNKSFSPICIRDENEVHMLDFGKGCYHNLMGYVDRLKNTKTGILLKGCDGRAFVQLVSEGILKRENLKILGVSCIEDRKTLRKCEGCYGNVPPVFDEMININGQEIDEQPLIYEEVNRIQALSEEERVEYFLQEFKKCIRCYACREVCPLCYCEECITEKSDPQWVEVSVKTSSNQYWNMIRAFHMAGRCIGCGECTRVCPSKIPLDILNARMSMEVQKLSGYIPGIDLDKSQLDLNFKRDK